ncbi:MAG: hypothetical protein PHF86_08045 [Candidatus Nanoarchaeia archaeon]|nr:hypothetical protein [Candidatus Nanoarchaeia archaeon]
MKLKLILLLSLVLLISAACTIPGGSQTVQNDVVQLNFLTSQPPTELYEGQTFRVGLNVKNYDTKQKDVILCVYDDKNDYFSGIPADDCRPIKIGAGELSGDNIIPFDQKVYFPSQDEFYSYNKLEKDMTATIVADVYYQHTTKSNVQICIKRDVETVTDVSCDGEEKITNGPGPVQISNLKKTIYPIDANKVRLMLQFDVQNVGSGKVSTKESARSKENIEPPIGLKVNLIGITDNFKCTPANTKGQITLKENQKTIKCEADINIEQDYIINPVEINLDYEYTTKILTSPIKLIKNEVVSKNG